MIFKKLKLENIRSYESFELEFPLGSILLSGDIGAGKTSILLALEFALFGLQPGQKGAALLRNGKDNASVSLEFEIDGKNILVERTLKRGKSISQDYNAITIDGEKFELSASEIKNRVIGFLDYPKEFAKKSNLLYKFTVYTPQEEMKAIIQERPEIRLDTLRHIFGIDRYRRIKENSIILLQKIKDAVKIKDFEIRETNILKEKLTLETEKKIKISKEINNLKIDYNELLDKKISAEKELKESEKIVEQKKIFDSELVKKDIEIRGKNEIKSRFEKEITLMQRQIQEKIDFIPERLQEVSKLLENHNKNLEELNSKFMEVNSAISVLKSKKEQSFSLKEKVVALEQCPTCFQPVTIEHKEKISKRTEFEIGDFDRELYRKIMEKDQLVKDIEKEKELIKGYSLDKTKLDQDKIKFQHQKEIETKIKSDSFILDRTNMEIIDLERVKSEIKSTLLKFVDSEKLFEDSRKQFQDIDLKLREVEINLAQKNKEVEMLSNYIGNLSKDIEKKEKIKLELNYIRELQDWLEDKFLSMITVTETNVLAKLRSEFSKILNEWFSLLVSESLSARLDEDFTPIITNQDYDIDYDFLSGGERTAVALAYRLALNQILNSVLSTIKTKDIIILDEPTDGFSEQQLDKMRDIFDQLQSKQIILVSHEQKIESFVDSVIRIKKDGTSQVG